MFAHMLSHSILPEEYTMVGYVKSGLADLREMRGYNMTQNPNVLNSLPLWSMPLAAAREKLRREHSAISYKDVAEEIPLEWIGYLQKHG